MQLRIGICAILLLSLSQVAFASLEYAMGGLHMMASSKITKRVDVSAEGSLRRSASSENQPSKKRQLTTCEPDYFPCPDGLGCCKFSPSL